MNTDPTLFPDDCEPRPGPAPVDRPRPPLPSGTPRLRRPERHQIEMHTASLDELLPPDEKRSGQKPQAMLVDGGFTTLVDGGFTTLDDIERVEQDGIQVNGPIKDEEKQKAQGIDPYQPGKKGGPGVSHWRARMGTPEAKIIYRLRAQTVEWANAGARNRGLYQVTVRGVQQVLAVVVLHALAHKLLRAVALRREKGFPEAAR